MAPRWPPGKPDILYLTCTNEVQVSGTSWKVKFELDPSTETDKSTDSSDESTSTDAGADGEDDEEDDEV